MSEMANHSEPSDLAMPVAVRRLVFGTLAVVIVGGLYLIAVRGEALLLDLGKLAAMCF